jgi:hypothetical protein
MFDYQAGNYCDTETGISNLNDEIRPIGYRARAVYGVASGFDLLRRVVDNPNMSYAIVGLSNDYFEGKFLTYRPVGNAVGADHSVVVLLMNDVDSTLFDPYENYNRPRGSVSGTKVGNPDLNYYWTTSTRPGWMAWIERTTRPIESYSHETEELAR